MITPERAVSWTNHNRVRSPPRKEKKKEKKLKKTNEGTATTRQQAGSTNNEAAPTTSSTSSNSTNNTTTLTQQEGLLMKCHTVKNARGDDARSAGNHTAIALRLSFCCVRLCVLACMHACRYCVSLWSNQDYQALIGINLKAVR